MYFFFSFICCVFGFTFGIQFATDPQRDEKKERTKNKLTVIHIWIIFLKTSKKNI